MNAEEYMIAMIEMTDSIDDTSENMDRVSMTILSAAIQLGWSYVIVDEVVLLSI